MSSEASRDPNTFTEEGWTNILEVSLQGWDVTDVLTIFENNDTFIKDWHNSLGDTCGLLPMSPCHAVFNHYTVRKSSCVVPVTAEKVR